MDLFDPVRLLIYDCDGTLVESEYIASLVFPKVWAGVGLEISPETFLTTFVGVASSAPVVQDILSRLPPEARELGNAEFERELERSLTAVGGMTEVVRSTGLPSCVASNSGPIYLEKVLRTAGLWEDLEGRIFSAHQVERPKPAPDVFLFAARQMNVAPRECLVIEDSAAGVTAARAAGMRVAAFMGGRHFLPLLEERLRAAGADIHLRTARDLATFIKTLNP